ncbi:MAG: hypothetical protein L0Y39_05480 [Methylococcaceae bacterium]|nr:hypothetical protein [Methylococcaceae bacterium]
MKTLVKQLNKFLLGLGTVVAYVAIAYLANLLVAESFGGVNPLVEFTSIGISKIDPGDSKVRDDLSVAFEACKKDLPHSRVAYEFPDRSYQAWNLDEGRFLIQSKVYTSEDSGSSVAANLMCRVLKMEDNEYLATHWTVQKIQVNML